MALPGCLQEQSGNGANSANASVEVEAASATRAGPPPCPAEELSCGLQKSVVSDGIRAFRNENMGLSALFPAGSNVCLSRSGDAPRGFYAFYGKPQLGCPEGDFESPATMGIGSSFNATFIRSLQDLPSGECLPLRGRVAELLPGEPLAIVGHRSLACQEERKGGRLQIRVHALAGRRPDTLDEDAPIAIYWAFLATESNRLEHDLAMFQDFLRSLRIGQFD
jgi:hypothetical protein